jgi:hypothetical protein
MENEPGYFLAGTKFQRVGCKCEFTRIYNHRVLAIGDPRPKVICTDCADTGILPCHMGELA